jgi:hypothetical protein
MDQTGRVVFNENINSTSGFNTHRLNVANLAAGIYQLQVVRGNQTATRKVVIE